MFIPFDRIEWLFYSSVYPFSVKLLRLFKTSSTFCVGLRQLLAWQSFSPSSFEATVVQMGTADRLFET